MKDVRLDDSGVYSCQATNGFGHRTVDFTVHVFDEDNTANSPKESLILANTTMPPTWLSDSGIGDSNAVQVNNGGRLELRCPAMGRPLPDIRWYKNGILLGTTSLPSSAIFIIDPATKSDTGEYRCQLENAYGSLDAMFHVTVDNYFDESKKNPTIEPSIDPIIEQPYNITVMLGHTAQFQCKAKASQSPLIKWLKEVTDPQETKRKDPNATVISANGMHLLMLEHIQTESVLKSTPDNLYINRLTIPLVNEEHAGRYICVVTSTTGHIVYKAAELHVVPSDSFAGIVPAANLFWMIVAPIAFLFIVIVTGAIIWLKRNQELPKTVLKPPPPPKIPIPSAPTERRMMNGMSGMNGAPPSLQHTPVLSRTLHLPSDSLLDKSRSPMILKNSMFLPNGHSQLQQQNNQRSLMGIATLDRKNLPRTRRGLEDVSRFYDSGSPSTQLWKEKASNYSSGSGYYRTLEMGYAPQRLYPSMCNSDDYQDTNMPNLPFIDYRH
ncbi:hypothetical protein WR25_09711 [Diploscapter pachys]|uniref:receptor protein-tyrosine kinase n=1 Tax=Diploscapter pachys TaxID=2018661 RepID=A0A2A2KZP6_9BILA|nr:hypothetical protein WR25_09711 [Diploscapter pachys]